MDGAVVDERSGARLALADVDVRVWKSVLLEPFDDFDPQLAGCDSGSFEHVLCAP